MALRQRTRSLTAAGGLDNALQNLAPQPIIANRAPTASDTAPLGTIWDYAAANSFWVLTSIVNGAAIWTNASGGAGVFTSLLVNPGPVTTQGTGAVSISGDAVATTVGLGNGAGAKTVTVGSTNTTSTTTINAGSGGITISAPTNDVSILGGTLDIGDDAAATVINIGNGAAVKTVTLGSVNTTSSTALQSGTGGLSLASGSTTAGLIGVTPNAQTAASPTATVTANSRVIKATFTGFTTANTASQVFVITSSLILTSSACLAFATNLNASAAGARMAVSGTIQAAGSLSIQVTNNGDAPLGTGDSVIITVWILS